ncbi:MAG TPA: ATP-binding protein [Gammaproteobacteria bacterium]
MRFSIRARLLLILLSLTAAIWLATAWSSYLTTRHEVHELFDAQLAQTARSMLLLSRHELQELAAPPAAEDHIHFIPEDAQLAPGHRYEQAIAYQIWLRPQGTLLLRTDNAPDAPLSVAGAGFSDRTIDAVAWRIYTLDDTQSGFQIQMGQSYTLRNNLVNQIALHQVLPLLLALPLLSLLISYGIHRALVPLRALTQAVERRAPDSLEPVTARNIPDEIRPLVTALNQLFTRLAAAFENERRFTADAAHELRTPLAALKVQAQVAQRASSDEQRRTALTRVLQGVDRATHLIEQLLTLARLDPQVGLTAYESVDLARMVREVVAELQPAATARRIQLTVQGAAQAHLPGQGDSLRILLGNLLDNALRYTPETGQVRLTLTVCEQEVVVQIDDSGPGVSAEEREQIFNRFYRGRDVSANGSGLGLSIVKRIADLHHATLHLERSELGGLCVRLALPSRPV